MFKNKKIQTGFLFFLVIPFIFPPTIVNDVSLSNNKLDLINSDTLFQINSFEPVFEVSDDPYYIYDHFFPEDYTPPQIFTYFPVDIDLLFDNSTLENPGGVITPFHWHNKAYGSAKNYFAINEHINPQRNLSLTVVADVYDPCANCGTNDPIIMEGVEVYPDCGFDAFITEDIILGYGHIYLLKEIADGIINGSITEISAGEQIGFAVTDEIPGLDFSIRDLNVNHYIDYQWVIYPQYEFASPYYYFTNELQQKMWDYYYTYNYPNLGNNMQPNFCGFRNHNIPGTSWGFWFEEGSSHPAGINNYSSLALYNIQEFTNNETFRWIPEDINTGTIRNITRGYDIGLLTEVLNYYGRCYFTRLSGNETLGIYNRTGYGDFNYGFKTDYQYFRYELIPGKDLKWGFDDQLIIEAFETYTQANAGFTENAFTYIRGTGDQMPPEPEGNPLFRGGGITSFPEFNLDIIYEPFEEGYLQINMLDDATLTDQIPKGFLFLNFTLEITPYFYMNNITLEYDSSELSLLNLEPCNIGMYVWNNETNQWSERPLKIDEVTNTIMLEDTDSIFNQSGGYFIAFGEKTIEFSSSTTSKSGIELIVIPFLFSQITISIIIKRKSQR